MPPPRVLVPIPAEAPLHPAPPSHHRSLQNPALSVSPVDLTTLDALAVGTRGQAWHSVRGDVFQRQLFPSHPASPCLTLPRASPVTCPCQGPRWRSRNPLRSCVCS
ncbi:unnamed protein product [Rangifer tarandus platyrhynchus]|uniref:Uncharacterized protein n=1 Tax=Rangifer tarandus platyrhynchus TaxID=3082113 RepID=A0AC59ZVL2_RANTA